MEKETNYLVVEVHNAYAVVLDNSGRFIKAANCGYEVGDTVDSIIPMIYPQDKKKRTNNIIRLAASLAACICLCVFGIYEYQFMYTEYGSVHMQINPEVEITLSRSGRVLDIEGENADGKELVKDYEYKGKDKETVVDELADLAIEQQYLADAGRISIEVDARSDEWAKKMETEITDELNDYLQGQGMAIEITIGPVEDGNDTEDKATVLPDPYANSPREKIDPYAHSPREVKEEPIFEDTSSSSEHNAENESAAIKPVEGYEDKEKTSE